MKRKILFVIPTLIGGGAEKVLITILKNLSKDKYDVTILLLYNTGVYVNSIPSWIEIITGPTSDHNENYYNFFSKSRAIFRKRLFDLKQKIYRNLIRRLPKITRCILLKNKKFDLEIAFLEGIPCHLISNWGGKSIKWGWIHTDPINSPDTNACSNYRNLDKIICVSNQIKYLMAKHHNIPINNMEVIYNPIDTKRISELSLEATNISKNGVTAIYIGRLSDEKGVRRLINALNIVNTKGHTLNLWIVGGGNLEGALREQTSELKLNNKITFFGFLENPYKLLQEADFLVSASDFEGFSLTIAESLYLKKPVVSTRTLGPTELLQKGKLGLLCDVNEHALANALIEMQNSETRNKYIANISTFKFTFDLDTSIKKIENILDHVDSKK